MEKELHEVAKVAKATPAQLKDKVEHMLSEIKSLQSEVVALKSKLAKDALGNVMNQITEVKGCEITCDCSGRC